MLTIEGTRFGDVSVPNEAIIHFPRGLIGFAAEDRFVLLERGPKSQIGYLQSVTTPKLCFPVVDGAVAGKDYPRPTAPELARDVGLSADDVAVLVVVAVSSPDKPLKANLLAPIVVDATSRTGAQVVLDHRRFTAAADLESDKPPSHLASRLTPPAPPTRQPEASVARGA